MSSKTDIRLTPGQRLARGLKYTAVGPVDVTRGTVGLSIDGAQSAVVRVRHSIDKSRLAKELGEAQEVLANLPAVIAEARKPKPKRSRRRPLLLVAAGVVVVAGGAVAFSIIRRSTQPEPSPLPPSVEVAPRV